MKINADRLLSRIEKMNKIGALPGGGNRRLALSDEDKKARDLLSKWMKEAKLEIVLDEVGNMYGTRKGTSSKQPALALGSHLDTVSTGGRDDGTYGVLAALEVVSVLNDYNASTSKPLVIVNFTNEEGARFAPDMMGSLAISKPELRDMIWKAKDLSGTGATVKQELKRIGYLGKKKLGSMKIDRYLELHIEQGPILEKEKLNIGIVEKVQGIYWTEYILTGQAAHAGTTPLSMRRDPSLVASRLNMELRELVAGIPGQLGTIGLMEFYPNVINVVPERVRFITDLRNPDGNKLMEAQDLLDAIVQREAFRGGIEVSRTEQVRLAPVDFSSAMVGQLEASTRKLGLTSRHMVSGAGHDAQMMAAVAKAAMIFVPSVGGISHNEKEFTKPEDLVNGANVLLDAALALLNL